MSVQTGFRCFSADAAGRDVFRKHFDQRPFLFEHSLVSDPLFSMPALQALAAKLSMRTSEPGFLRISNKAPSEDWGTAGLQKAVTDAFGNIEQSKMRLKLSAVHSEKGHRELLDDCTWELSDLSCVNLRRYYRGARATIFISSPHQITPYHIDQEANFLLEIVGNKTLYIVDGNDRDALQWRDLEEYWGRGGGEPPKGLHSRARSFQLRPGLGVHNPGNFPHWVENGPSPSVTLSVGFTRVRNPVDVLRVNFYLRKLHLAPTPPGTSELRDSTKRAIVHCARTLKSALAMGRGVRLAD